MIPPYRGLSIDEDSKGQWQYGYLIEDSGEAFIINEVIEANEQYITIGSWCPVNPETVGRFTGLFDKNCKEIFEKDILFGHAGEDFWEFVEFDRERAKWVRTDLNDYKLDLSENVTELEIVGNVYQNEEFLEAGHDRN